MTQPPDGPASTPGAVHSVARRGLTWLISGTLVSRMVGLLAQVVLGALLLKSDFGLFAVASAITLIVRSLQDAGLRAMIVQLGDLDFDAMRGDVFWLATTMNVTAALGLWFIAPSLANLYGAPALTSLLRVMALWILVNSPWSYFSAVLSRDLRFAHVAGLNVVWAFAQHGMAIALAIGGAGAMAFVVPLPLAAVVGGLAGSRVVRDRPWRVRPQPANWPRLFSQMRWLILGNAAVALFTHGDYIAIGLFASAATLGIYFFAYQIAAQMGVLISTNLHAVLFPTLARLAVVDQRALIVRSLALFTSAMSLVSLFVAAIFPAVERLLWGGKWTAAVLPLQLLAAAFPLRLRFDVANAQLMARGLFKRLSLLQLYQGVGLMTVAGLGAGICDNTSCLAGSVAGYLAASGVIFTAIALAGMGHPVAVGLTAGCLPWAIACACLLIVEIASTQFGLRPLIDLMARGALFAVLVAGLMRLFAPSGLRELVAVARPNRRGASI